MKTSQLKSPLAAESFRLTTEEFATRQRVRPQTVRARLCKTGSYFSVVPKKHPNGRWLWPDEVAA